MGWFDKSNDDAVNRAAAAKGDPRIDPAKETQVLEAEHYAGQNFPYRGTELHGVPVDGDQRFSDPVDWNGTPVELRQPDAAPPDPIPVLIVNESGGKRERKVFRAFQSFVRANETTAVAQRDDRRTKVSIANLSGNTVWIGADSIVNAGSGFPIPGNTSRDITTEDALYVFSSADSAIAVAIESTKEV